MEPMRPPDPFEADEVVSGEPVAPPTAAVIPSTAEKNAAVDRARGRTSIQVGIPAALVGIGSWWMRLHHVDLDPGAGTDLPADVAGYFVAVVGLGLAFAMNRKTKD